MTKNISSIIYFIKISILSLFLLPILSLGGSTPTMLKGSQVQQKIIKKGDGYEVKNIIYQDKKGNHKNIELIFIKNSKGAINAHNEIGLPAKEKDEIIKNNRLNQNKSNKTNEPDIVVIDKALAFATSDKEIKSILLSRGVPKKELDAKFGRRHFTCWVDRHREWDRSFNEDINKDWNLGNDATFSIATTLSGDAEARLEYRIKKTSEHGHFPRVTGHLAVDPVEDPAHGTKGNHSQQSHPHIWVSQVTPQ